MILLSTGKAYIGNVAPEGASTVMNVTCTSLTHRAPYIFSLSVYLSY